MKKIYPFIPLIGIVLVIHYDRINKPIINNSTVLVASLIIQSISFWALFFISFLL